MTKFVARANRRVSASEPLRRYRATGESPQPPFLRGAKAAFVGCVLRCTKFERMRTKTVKIEINFVDDTSRGGARCTKFVYVSLSPFGFLRAGYALRMRRAPYTFIWRKP